MPDLESISTGYQHCNFLPGVSALSAGDMHGKMFREMVRNRTAAGKDWLRLATDNVLRLQSRGIIGSTDAQHLTQIAKIVFSKTAPGDMLVPVRNLQTALMDDDQASPIAIAIAGIALDSVLTGIQTGTESVIGADLGGALGGAIFGGGVGAIFGAGFASATAYLI